MATPRCASIAGGARTEPALRPLELSGDDVPPLTASDVLLVTGGGKGIAAECALALARQCGCRLALLGRSDPTSDPELASNLERVRASGVAHRYFATDITDAGAVRAAVKQAESALGPVTAVLHGAGVNLPELVRSLGREALARTVAVKVEGAAQRARRDRCRSARAVRRIRLDHRSQRPARRGRLCIGERVAHATHREPRASRPALPRDLDRVVGVVRRRHGRTAGTRRTRSRARA